MRWLDVNENKFNKRELLKYIGNTSQWLGVQDYLAKGGKADRVRYLDIGNGLELTVLTGTALDIANLSYKGMNFSYISNTGIVAPQYFNETGQKLIKIQGIEGNKEIQQL